MKRILLTQGRHATVDDEDYDYLMQWKWYANKIGKTYYAVRNEPHAHLGWLKGQTIYMHRIILKVSRNNSVDHKNHNGLDNRKCNLRICSKAQNQQNQIGCNNGESQYKGIRRSGNKWQARICTDGLRIHIGTFPAEGIAAKAYDKKAKELFGDFAYLNFPKGEHK